MRPRSHTPSHLSQGRFLALERPTAGSIVHVTTPVPQLFRCIPCGAAEEQGEARLAHFLQHLLLPLTGCTLGQKKYQDLAKRATMAEEASSLATAGPSVAATGEYAAQGRTILFVASYFEFIRLRNALQAEAPNRFVFCSECVACEHRLRFPPTLTAFAPGLLTDTRPSPTSPAPATSSPRARCRCSWSPSASTTSGGTAFGARATPSSTACRA